MQRVPASEQDQISWLELERVGLNATVENLVDPFESLITHETHQTASRVYPPALEGELIRLHVGLEDPSDLIADLERGLAAFRAALTLP